MYRDCVFVGCDVDELEDALDAAPVDALGPQVHQHQVVLGAAGHQRVAQLLHRRGEGLRVGQNLQNSTI